MAEPPKQGEPNIDEELDDLELRLERLRSLYEQYFLGIEKIEPSVARKDVDRRIWLLRRMKLRNTAKRFKLQTIIMRYNTFQQYWGRICREIENGTFKRHLLRAEKSVGMTEPLTIAAKRRLGMFARGRAKPEAEAPEPRPPEPPVNEPAAAVHQPAPAPAEPARAKRLGSDLGKLELDMDDMFGPRPAAPSPPKLAAPPNPPKPVAPAPPPPPKRAAPPAPNPPKPAPAPPQRPRPAAAAPPAAGMSDQRVRELHQRLVDAQSRLPNTRPVSIEGLARSLRAAETKLRAQHGNRKIDFDVIVKDGRAVVKPILR